MRRLQEPIILSRSRNQKKATYILLPEKTDADLSEGKKRPSSKNIWCFCKCFQMVL